jgi:hypothetical protein
VGTCTAEDGSARLVRRLVDAAAELAEVGAEHAQCRTCRCYRRPAEEALSILARASPDEPIASYLRKILVSPGLEHG